MSTNITLLFTIIQLTVFCLLALPLLYLFIFAIAGLFYRRVKLPLPTMFRKIAVLIPAYKEDAVIVDVARDALRQDYPEKSFDVIIIADSLLPQTLENLNALPVRMIQVHFEKSTKSKALNAAFGQLPDDYDLAVVLDADNLMEPGFLQKVNAAFERDIIALQGHRKAKNLDSSLAVLDAVSEEINNHIFRKGHRALGFSSAIIGSGMAFRYEYFKKLMSTVTAVGGFDKEIELKMLKEGYSIEYLDEAIVRDEKTGEAETFSNQRRRWLSAQFGYFRRDAGKALPQLLLHGNLDYFEKTLQFIQPPRILLLGAIFLSATLFIILDLLFTASSFYVYIWLALLFSCSLTFLISIPLSFYDRRTFAALGMIPKGIMLMIGSLLRTRGANKEFLHTRHNAIRTHL